MSFFKFLQKKVSQLGKKKSPALFEQLYRFCHMIFTNYNPQSHPKLCRNFFVKPGNFFSAEIWKMTWKKNIVWDPPPRDILTVFLVSWKKVMFHIGFLSKYWLMMMMIIMILSDYHFGVLKIASKIIYKLQLVMKLNVLDGIKFYFDQ